MKKILLPLLFLIFSSAVFSQSGWTLQNDTGEDLYSLHFINSTHGWAAGWHITMRTTDGGDTWTKDTWSTEYFFDIYFTDTQNGWIVGGEGATNGKIWHTTNGGVDWAEQTSNTSSTLRSIFFVNSNTGWAVGDGAEIVATADGGATWVPQNAPLGIYQNLKSVWFADVLNGWAVGADGAIINTTNGGALWGNQSTTLSDYLYDVCFIDENNGWAAGEKLMSPVILHTNNGGASWTNQYSAGNPDKFICLSAVDNIHCWSGADEATIVYSPDGGTNWWEQNSNTTSPNSIDDIIFIDQYTGWYLDSDGQIFHTSTSGCDEFTIDLGNDTSVCISPPIILDAGSGYDYYTWQDNSHNSTYHIPVEPGTGSYSVTVIYTGCTETDDITVTVSLFPTADILPDDVTQVCVGDSLHLDGNPSGGSGTYVTHTWTGETSPLSATDIVDPWFYGTTPGAYTIIYNVIDDIGCESDDNEITLNVMPTPAADIISESTEVCADTDLQLDGNPSGGTGNYASHTWTGDTGPLSATNIVNPVFNASQEGMHLLYYTVVDNDGCEAKDTIAITVFENPVVLFDPVSTEICPGTDLSPAYNITGGSGSGVFTHSWAGDIQYLDASDVPAPVFNSETPGNYQLTLTVTDEHGCTGTDNIDIVVYDWPAINDLGNDTLFCWGDDLTLDAGTGTFTYAWSDGSTNQTLTVDTTNTYSVIVTDQNECTISDEIIVEVSVPYQDQQICMVLVDSLEQKNLVVWERTPCVGIDSFFVYREHISTNNYILIGKTAFEDPTYWIDMDSEPLIHSDKYKITVLDTCGNESYLENSTAHKTILLTVSENVQDGGFSLIWNHYEGYNFGTYRIYRGTGPADLAELNSIPYDIGTTIYNDINAPVGNTFYQIAAIKPDGICSPDMGGKVMSGPFSQSLSNLDDDYATQDIIPEEVPEYMIFPNPFTSETTIKFKNPGMDNFTLKISNITGQIVRIYTNIKTDRITVKRNDLPAGIYTFKLTGNNGISHKGKMIIY